MSQRQTSGEGRVDPGPGGEPRESKLKDLRLTGNPRDPRLSSSDPRSYRRSLSEQRHEAQAASWDPVASAKPPSAGGGGAVPPLLGLKLHGNAAAKPGRPSPASASGKPSPVSAAKPSSGSTKSPSGGSSGYSSSGKPSPVSSTGGPPSPFTKPVASPAQAGKAHGSPGSRRRSSGKAAVLQSHLQEAGDPGAVSGRVGCDAAQEGCLVWEGQLVSKNSDLCTVNMIVYGTAVKPARR